MNAREEVLARLRAARAAGAPADGVPPVPRDYRRTSGHPPGAGPVLDLLTGRIEDYQARVYRVRTAAEVPDMLARLLQGAGSVAVPPGLSLAWLGGCAAAVRVDGSPAALTARELDEVAAVVTTCAVAIAETGTIVLDAADPAQGRRLLTLVPDHHVCVVSAADVVTSVPEALPRLAPLHPLTFISGPSATSDIELERVEGVHGPRRLDVVLIG